MAAPVIQYPKRTKVGKRCVRVAMDDWAKKMRYLPNITLTDDAWVSGPDLAPQKFLLSQ